MTLQLCTERQINVPKSIRMCRIRAFICDVPVSRRLRVCLRSLKFLPEPTHHQHFLSQFLTSFVFQRDQVDADMERRQRAIKRHLSVYCQENHRKSGLPSLGNIFVTKTPQLLYCMVPKVASRQWRSLLARLNRTRLQPQHNPTEVKYFFSRNYKFMFVREPFERLLSAYKDKFVNPVRPSAYRNYQSYRRKIVAREALSADENPTFPESTS